MDLHFEPDMVRRIDEQTLGILDVELHVEGYRIEGEPTLHNPLTITFDRSGMQHTLSIYAEMAEHVVRHNGGDGPASFTTTAHDHVGLRWILDSIIRD